MEETNLCFIGAGFHASANIYPAVIEAGINIKAIATMMLFDKILNSMKTFFFISGSM